MDNQKMHPIQQKLLNLSKHTSLQGISYRELGRLIGDEDPHPQQIKFHLEQLQRKRLLLFDQELNNAQKEVLRNHLPNMDFLSIPILGYANCGPARCFADQQILGYIKVPSSLYSQSKGLFALIAQGDSMNLSNIKNKNIEDGDYVIIDSTRQTPLNGEYVVSVIDDATNIKKFRFIREANQVVLYSETTQQDIHFPIYIDLTEVNDYKVNGVVIDVLKKPA